VVVLSLCFVTLAVLLASGMLGQRIIDDVERDLPIERRESWKLFKHNLGLPMTQVRLHSQMYPESRLRKWFWGCTAAAYTLVIGGSLWLILAG
jgi:hypothetical protein